MSDAVRVINSNDYDQIKELVMKAFKLPEKMVRPSCNRKWFEKRQKEGLSLVYERDGKILGYVGGLIKKNKLYIYDFCVDPDCRGQGIGTKLILKQKEFALAKGITHMWGTTMPTYQEAVSLYKKLGYTIKTMPGGMIYFEWRLESINKGL